MDQKGRLAARGIHGRLLEALTRYRMERDLLVKLLEDALGTLGDLSVSETDKQTNLELSSYGLISTPRGESITYAVEVLDDAIESLQNLYDHIEISESDVADIDLTGLFDISKI